MNGKVNKNYRLFEIMHEEKISKNHDYEVINIKSTISERSNPGFEDLMADGTLSNNPIQPKGTYFFRNSRMVWSRCLLGWNKME